jgi:hypothetical protein
VLIEPEYKRKKVEVGGIVVAEIGRVLFFTSGATDTVRACRHEIHIMLSRRERERESISYGVVGYAQIVQGGVCEDAEG